MVRGLRLSVLNLHPQPTTRSGCGRPRVSFLRNVWVYIYHCDININSGGVQAIAAQQRRLMMWS